MVGYYKATDDGRDVYSRWFLKTGDQGVADAEGYLTITVRIKDLFKTDKGNVAPSPIEMKLLTNADVEQVCVVGMGIPQPIALTVLSESGKKKSNEEIIATYRKHWMIWTQRSNIMNDWWKLLSWKMCGHWE